VQKEKIKENNEKIIENSKLDFSMAILLFAITIYDYNLDIPIEKLNENKIFGGGQRNQ
jgi:hypothetical protein